MRLKVYFVSGQAIEFETSQFHSFGEFVGQLSQVKAGDFMIMDGTRAVARDHIEFIEQLDD